MRFVDSGDERDPRRNLALEEYLLRHRNDAEPLLLFYRNAPAVIIGRNQNTLSEIDPDYVASQGVHVVRRLSGGGAVYHDLGNLNFSFITPAGKELHNFARFIEPVVAVLRQLGVPAALRGQSDIFVDGKKVSGNAQAAAAGRLVTHGTLLFDSDLEAMLRALNPRQDTITTQAVQSIRNVVTNCRPYLPASMTVADLQQAILVGLFGGAKVRHRPLDAAAWAAVDRIVAERYGQWAWNYGHSPPFNIHKQGRLAIGKLEARLEIEEGMIHHLRLSGDFAGSEPVANLEERLTGVRYDPGALAAALEGVDLTRYLGDLEPAALVAFLY